MKGEYLDFFKIIMNFKAVESIALAVSLFTWKFELYVTCLRAYAVSKMAFLCFMAYKMLTSDERISRIWIYSVIIPRNQ